MAEERDIAIQIEGLRKRYRLGTIGGGTLKGDIESWWARKRGKEDPNSKIGAKQHVKNEIFYALDGIDLTIYKGERIGIIGHNGAGKSTLLKLLSRVTAPTEGKICIDGRIASMLEVGTGFSGELTGRENVYLNGAILGMTKAEVDAKMEQIIDFSEVRQFIDTPVKRYSSGMYVKLAFSVAAHLDSEIMIMDEVLAVGDMAFQKKCLTKMREVSEAEGRTVLYVSHNMNTIRQLCDRCIVLSKGKVIYNGDVEEAIMIYLGTAVEEKQAKTFTDNDHENWCENKIKLIDAKIANNIATIYSGDIVDFFTKILVVKPVERLRARLVILDRNGVIIGMAISNNTFSLAKGVECEVRFSFDTSHLAAGKYMTRLSFFEINEYGTHEYVCVVNDFMTFSINENSLVNYGMRWDVKSWGYIAFNPFTIEVDDEDGDCNMDNL